ncbi:hypothetical protein V6Z11_A05G331100 [Gossypium hirsutum]
MSEQNEREQENTSVLTNHTTSSLYDVSFIQVFEDSRDKFQLQYLLVERHFHLTEKGKVEGGIQPQVFNGKESLATERQQSGLSRIV